MRRLAGASLALAVAVTAGCAGSGDHTQPLPARLRQSSGGVFYVATSGSDGNPGTAAAPWLTVQKAFDTLQPGQTALVRAGVYSQNLVVRRAGTASAPITVRDYPGERPVLHPALSSPSYPLRLTTGAAFVRVQGFVIEDAQGASTMNVVGLGANPGAHDYEISDCEIRNARNSSGVFIDNTNYHVWLLGNTVHDNNEDGVQHQGIYLEASDSVIANNVVYHQTNGFGIQVRAGARNVIVANNTVADVSLSGIMVENSASGVLVVNNISAFNGGYAVRGLDEGGSIGAGNTAYNNLGFANSEGEFANSSRGVVDFSRGNTVDDPKFVDPAGADFHIRPEGAGRARATRSLMPTRDRDGRLRSQPGDLGAYEHA